MSSIGTGYDLSSSTFSPDGRIFQVQYAMKAVENSSTSVALRVKVVCKGSLFSRHYDGMYLNLPTYFNLLTHSVCFVDF